jgi:signal transduction histidine kinase/ActR/RegA family two-component response regulator
VLNSKAQSLDRSFRSPNRTNSLISSFDRSVVIVAALVVALLIGGATLDVWNTRRLNKDAASVEHAQRVLNLTSDVLRTLLDAESGVRGFQLVGRDDYLHSYNGAIKRLDGKLAALLEETNDDPEQYERVQQLRNAAALRMARLQVGISLRRTSFEKAQAYVASGNGQSMMDGLRELTAEIEGAEHAVLEAREFRSRHAYLVAQAGALLSAIMGFLMFAAFCWLLNRRIEDAKKIQEAQTLKEADRRKNEFLATLAHELRNPLAPIRIAVEVLGQTDVDSEAAQRARAIVVRKIGHMVRLIDDLRDVSAIAKGKLQLRKERVELAAVVQNAAEEIRPVMDAARHDLEITLPTESIYLDADPTRLVQVFSNLLNNAAKYTDRGGRIWLTAQRRDGEVVVSVRDTGIGLDTRHLTHIFDMYSQLAPALERSQGGLGVGLSLVRGLIELHGGTIEARSDGPGKGSEFLVRLPVLADSTPELAPAPDGVAPVPSAQRILVVDDDREATESLAFILERMGHDVRTGHDGLEAVQTATAFRPEVVLLDIDLPKMSGYEAAHQIRHESWGTEVTIVAVTGWVDEEDKRRALGAGFDHFMTKPIEVPSLQNLLAIIDANRKELLSRKT